jgi:glycosyltransferase involved in cell wall biosynthesis
MRIALVAKPGSEPTGVGRYTGYLRALLAALGHDLLVVHPTVPLPGIFLQAMRTLLGWDMEAFLNNHPIWARYPQADLYHVTSQNLATLLLLRRLPGPTVVTVHDIIPWLVRDDPLLRVYDHRLAEWFDWLALAGLRRADALIAVSNYTKQTLVDELGIPADRIHVVYEAVDTGHFRPHQVPRSFTEHYCLAQESLHVLFVGSEDPRKNLSTLIRAFAEVKREVGNVRLLKVGAYHFEPERERLSRLITELGLEDDVRFFGQVPEKDLPLFYNAAHVLVLPSFYEGFGLPVAEAMACGTPVVCSNATSLPEVAGPAALLVSPRDPEAMATALLRVLTDLDLAGEMRRKGLSQAAGFTPARVTAGLMGAYAAATGEDLTF